MTPYTFAGPLLAAALAILSAACAPQSAGTATPPAASLSGPPSTTPAAMPVAQGTGTVSGMDHNAMMAHCAQMRQGTRPGMAMSADMRQMMAQCDQMDRSMGMGTQRR